MKRGLGLVLLAAFAAAGACRPPAGTGTVRVAAAADLRYVLDEAIATLHRDDPGLAVSVTYGSSGTFFAQLVNRAPFDLYLSADLDYPRQLAERGLTIAGTEFTYGVGRLVLWVPLASSIDVGRLGMRALLASGVSHVAIANPEHAPYGRAAEAAMRRAGIYDRVRPRLVFGENVSQALQFVESGSADIGVVALSLALSPPVANGGKFWEVPLETYPRIDQGGVILQWAIDPDAARRVRAFMLGDTGRTILKRFGFFLPGA